jgi:DNA repair photolyase
MSRSSALTHVTNPPNPWHDSVIDFDEMPPPVSLTVIADQARQILTRNTSPDLPFRWSLNPYRGCYHGCAYCYARPSHQYLDLGAGTDFERTLVIKPDAPALLREAFDRRSWTGEHILFSGNTDCYQPLELSYGLTRGCLEVCRDYRNPVSVITKSTLIERDLELLVDLDRRARCSVTVSVPFMDPELSRAIEPYVPSPRRRIETIRRLAQAGLSVRVNVAPIIPGLTDDQIPAILEAAREAGATQANFILLRLDDTVAEIFEARLRAALPERADRVMNQLRDCRGGRTNDPRFGRRMGGFGARYQAIEALFETTARRLGLTAVPPATHPATFSRPHQGHQLDLL